MNKIKFLNTKPSSNLLIVILSIANLVFLGYILTIGYHNTILVDDFYFLAKLKEHGYLGSIYWWYNNWQGRIMPYLLINIVLVIYQKLDTILPLTIFFLGLYTFSVYNILKNLGLILKNKLLVINLIILSFAQILFTSFEPSTFYWVNVSTMYYGGMIFLLLGISEVLSASRKILSYIIIAISFFYVGCSSEHIGALTSATLIGLFIYSHIWKKAKVKNARKMKLAIATSCCCTAFIIMYLAPGNEIRVSNFPKISIIESIPIAIDSYLVLIKEILKRSPYLIGLGLPFVLLGYFQRNLKVPKNILNHIFVITLALTIFLFAAMIPTAYATSSMGPKRALIFVNFLITFYTIFVAYLFGLTKMITLRKIWLGTGLSIFVYLAILAKHYALNLPSTIEFSEAHRKQILFLKEKQKNDNKDKIYLSPIIGKKGNILWEDQLSSDPNYWLNNHIREGLQLDFEIIGIDR